MSSTALFRPETKIAGAEFAPTAPSNVVTSLGTISLRIATDPRSLKGLWESMQAATPCTVAQTYDWGRAWVEHVLAPRGGATVIAVGYGPGGTPVFLWPFETETRYGLRVLKWLGQDHANYNMGLFSPDAARAFTRADASRLLHEVARQSDAAAALLEAQPLAWDDVPNPFALLSHQRAPNSGYAIKLGPFGPLYESRFSKRSRQTLDRKERRLRDLGSLDYRWAESREDRLAVLETFFAQKARQLAAMGVENIFDADARAFYGDLAFLSADNPSRLRLGYVTLDNNILATFSGTLCHDRMSVMLSSLTEDDAQRQSPGALLLRHEIEEACDDGLKFFDLGVGQARHKDEWSNTDYALFDSFVAFKPQGLALTLPRAATGRLKRTIKSNRRLWSFAQNLRKRFGNS